MHFIKMHGCGNDYIYVDCFRETVEDPSASAIRISDRHFGVGGDGLILIKPSDKADCFMDIYNADGSRAKMCGNGIRCVGKYIYESGLAHKPVVTVDTLSGIKTLQLHIEDDKVHAVTVDMGAPILEASEVPTTLRDRGAVIDYPFLIPGFHDAEGSRYVGMDFANLGTGPMGLTVTCVSMGNPHAVLLVDEPETFPVHRIGAYIEKHPAFPEGVNVQFIHVDDSTHLTIRTWERGAGETLACGTGNCAALVASTLLGKSEAECDLKALGGTLHVRWDREKNLVFLTGNCVEVFRGEFE